MSGTNDIADTPCLYPYQGWNPNTDLVIDTKGASLWGGYPAPIQAYAIRMATQIIWAATGRQFALCDTTIRPCWNPQIPTYQTYPSIWNAGQYGGAYGWGLFAFGGTSAVLGGFCGCSSSSSCACKPPEIELPAPVHSVLAVQEAAIVLPPTAYRLDDNMLVRIDGNQWIYRQDLASPIGAPNTWTVRYLRGVPVPDPLNDAAGILAGEYAKMRLGQACRLPQRITSVTRQGVTAQFANAQDMIDKGQTGILEVDQAITSYNPRHLQNRPRVWSLDMPQYRPVV